MNERHQFRCLLRGFSYRFLDNELMSAEGDSSQTTVTTVALLGAVSLTLSLIFFYKYAVYMPASFTAAQREAISLPDKHSLISLAMAVIGLAVVVTWDALFPDRRDCLTLSALPVRGRTAFAAKICSVVIVFGVVFASLNAVTTLSLPAFLAGGAGPGYVRYLSAHVAAIGGACLFVFATLLALQGVLINVFSFRIYKWLSTWVQLGTLFAILCVFFLTPNVSAPAELANPANRVIVHAVPAFWFLGLYQVLLGNGTPTMHDLARLAVEGLTVSSGVALISYSAGYARYVRKTVEEADTLHGARRGRASLLSVMLDRVLLRNPLERAVFHFAARTMARNRKHRLLLAVYAGVGLSYVFNGVAWVLQNRRFGGSRLFDLGISSVPLVLSFFVLFGMRVLFAVPVELRSNWVFRLTESARPSDYLAGVRKLMIVAGVLPLALSTFPVYWFLWGGVYAVRHLVLVILILLVVLEYLMSDFAKIPFTCSFLPGKANLKATIGIYLGAFGFFAIIINALELWLVRRPSGCWKGALILMAVLVYRAWRRNQWERRLPGFIFEESPTPLATLNIQS